MLNITGNPVTYKNFLKPILLLIEDLRELLRYCSVIIEAPRRFGKTSVIKEFMRQEESKKKKKGEFNVLFLELEGEETVCDFCFKFYKELLNLYLIRKGVDTVKNFLDEGLKALSSRLKKIKFSEFEIELREKTKNYNFLEWKEKITPLITDLNSFDFKTLITFDEFPDMLMNFKKKETEELNFKNTVDGLMAWLRSLRQSQNDGCKYRFVFCGSINLRKTFEKMGLSKRINDLEQFVIPPIKNDDAGLLIELLAKKYKMEIEPEGITFLVSKITGSSPYYGQLLIKALREKKEKIFTINRVKEIYKAMLQGGNHDLNHYHSRLENYMTQTERECSATILKHLCGSDFQEKALYFLLYKKCTYEQFQSILDRLMYEGYIIRDINDNGNIRFVSNILKDWWTCKVGVKNVCL